MKYISRITALLLVLMMLTPTFASALTLDNATQSDLDKLYDMAGNTPVVWNAGLLGDWTQLSTFGNLVDKDSYTFQWYDAKGTPLASYGESTDLLVVNTMEEQTFYCVATDGDGNQVTSPAVVLTAADISDPNDYLDWLYDIDYFTDVFGAADTLTIYSAVTDTWNVAMADGTNLAERIVSLWWSEREETYFDPYLLCSCVVSGAVESTECVLHPNSELHVEGCCWKQEEIKTDVDVSTPESLLVLDSVMLAAAEREDAESYCWQHYIYDAELATMRWEVMNYVMDSNLYMIPVTKDSIQKAYRVVVSTEDYGLYESKPFYLGGLDFYNWIQTTEGVLEWMADESVTLADVVAKYNAVADEEERINADDYTCEGENGESLNLKVPEGAFNEPYIMEVEPTSPSAETVNAVLQSMDATGTAKLQVLAAFDISFAALADRSRKLQPAEGTSVALTFEVSTVDVPTDDTYYIYVYHIADDGAPEVVAGPVEVIYGVQPIPVQADGFSMYVVMLSSDSCAYCSKHEECVYEMLILMSPDEQYAELMDLAEQDALNETTLFQAFVDDHNAHVLAGAPALLCTCDRLTTVPGTDHAEDCPWHTNYSVITDVLGATASPQLKEAVDGATYEWYELITNEDGSVDEVLQEDANDYVFECVVTLEPHTYVCKVTLPGQTTPVVYTYYIVAQTTALGSYVNYVLTAYYEYWDNDMTFEAYTKWVYDYVTNVLDVEIQHSADSESFNLGEAVVSFWSQSEYGRTKYPDLLCACGAIEAIDTPDVFMLPYEDEHDTECFWYHGAPAVKLMAEEDGTYSLYIDPVDEYGFWTGSEVIAISEMLDEKYHYFQDVTTGWYVAYLHEEKDAEGNVIGQWIIPLPSEKDLEETPAN